MTPISNFLDLLRTEFYGCPDPLLEQVVINSIRQFCQDSWFLEKMLVVEVDPAIDIDTDEMSSLTISINSLLQSTYVFLGIKSLRINGIPYDVEERDSTQVSDYINSYGKIFYHKQDSMLVFYPVSFANEVELKIAVSFAQGVTEVDDVLYSVWSDVIQEKAKEQLYAMPQQPWSDVSRIPWHRQQYRRGITRARIARQKDKTSKDLAVNSRSYVKWLE